MTHRTPPRFVIRTLVATLATVAFVLSAVLLVVTLNVQKSVRAGVVDRLETGQRLLAALEERRGQELLAQVAMLAENSTLKAAVDTYHTELRTTNAAGRQDLLATIARELDKLAARIQPEWIEHLAPHLVKRTHSAPYWNARSSHVEADERVTLRGLTVIPKRRVHYGAIDVALARETFIQHALVEGD